MRIVSVNHPVLRPVSRAGTEQPTPSEAKEMLEIQQLKEQIALYRAPLQERARGYDQPLQPSDEGRSCQDSI